MWNRVLKLGTLIFALLLPISFIALRAQELQCDEVIKKILQDTGDRCKDLGRNKGCYGNNLVMATPKTGVSPDSFVFNKPSDVVNIADVASLRMAGYKEGGSEWGVSYLRIQANFPDTQPGQYVTMLVFGDTSLEDRSKQVADKTKQPENPMQAVYFRSGTATLACKRAPTSGMIIQTPKGAAKAELTMNEVKMSVGSTVFIESPDDDIPPINTGATNTPTLKPTANSKKNKLVVTTIEGEAKITANGVTRTVPTGQKSEVQLVSDNSRPVGVPSIPVNASVEIQTLLGVVVQDSVDNTLLNPTATASPSITPGGPTLTFTPSATLLRPITFTPVPTLILPTFTPAGPPTNTPIPPPPTNTSQPTFTPPPTIPPPPTNTPVPTLPPPPTNTPPPPPSPIPPTNTRTNKPTNTPTP